VEQVQHFVGFGVAAHPGLGVDESCADDYVKSSVVPVIRTRSSMAFW